MTRVGIFIGEQGNASFLRDILEDLRSHYTTEIFRCKVYHTPLLHGRLNRWSFQHRIRSILRQSDVAFFEWASELLEPATKMRKYCPIVTRLHSYELYAWGPRINWDSVDRVILVSEAMRRYFIDEFPSQAHKTAAVPNAVDLDRFRPSAGNRTTLNLGMLCSFYPRKRIYEMILLFAVLRKKYSHACLHLAGGRVHGPDNDEYYVACRRLVRQLQLEDSVKFYGHVDATADWLRGIDVFVSNSFWEGQQVALLEAMACGCYCLSHSWMGAEEVLPPDRLYATDDELVAKIGAYADLPESEKRERHLFMSRIAREKFDVARQKERIREIIESALAAPRVACGAAVSESQP